MIFNKSRYIFFAFLLVSFVTVAQERPIGYWKSLLPYNSALGVATDGNTLYTICNQSFFTYNAREAKTEQYSKVEGMSDVGMQCISYDPATNTAILVYSNGNIDLFKDEIFYNIPDLKIKTVAGTKAVYQIYVENGMAYLSTSLGVLVIDIENRNVNETYQFYINNQTVPINSFAGQGNYFYAATPSGLFRAPKSSPELQNFQIWQKIDSTHVFTDMTSVDSTLFLCTSSAVYGLINDTLRNLFASSGSVAHIDPGFGRLFISESILLRGHVKAMDMSHHIVDSFITHDSIAQVVQLQDSSIWIANVQSGLSKRRDSVQDFVVPPGPPDPNSFDIYANNGDVWIAHGTYDDKYLLKINSNNISNYNNGTFRSFAYGHYNSAFDTTFSYVSVTKDEQDGTIYAGSFKYGLAVVHLSTHTTDIIQGDVFDQSISAGGYPVVSAVTDANDNLWLALFGPLHELYVKEKTTGNWYKYHVNITRPYPYAGGPMVFDDAGHAWYASLYGGGVVCYDTKNTLSDATDDVAYQLRSGVGYGNLPTNNTFSIAHDKSDNVWIGTDDGIAVVYNASSCASQRCDAEIPIVQYDQFAGYLFKGEIVRAIAVDGANRKWVGTDNGVWLLSPDAGNSSIIYRFTKDNSPLPSDHVQKIAIDKVTGDVYIGTDNGLVSYRSTATDGGTTNSNVLSFPNPVPSGYKGTIAIKGLVANADVRITDINGQLVYRTTALGGQAVWNGLDYKGHRPSSGVYLIFASSSDGTQTYAGKMVFLQ